MTETPRRLSFGAHAEAYERARPEWPETAARWLAPDDAKFVVEVGAGTGKLTQALARVAPRVLAVEPDPRMLARLRERGLEGVEGSAEAIPAGDGAADAVVAGSSLHWFDLEPALREFHRVLRPGGRLAFGWNHRDARRPEIERMSQLIAAVRPIGQSWRSRDWATAVTEGGLFGDVEHAEFPFVLELPRDALEDHLLSYSGIAALPDGRRAGLLAEIAAVLHGDPLELPFVVDAYRAVRTSD
jgi:SAM-dependent methyltransferase